MFAQTFCASYLSKAEIVKIQSSAYQGLPKIHITGLAGNVVKEARDRIQACLAGLGARVPSRKIIVHLGPASLKKQGSQFDLPIALCVLASEGVIAPNKLNKTAALGEISLDGQVRPIADCVALLSLLEARTDIETIFIPEANHVEAKLVRSRKARRIMRVSDVIEALCEGAQLPSVSEELQLSFPSANSEAIHAVKGHFLAKRALQISLAGKHHILFFGPPGVGKSMLSRCAPSLVPPLSRQELRDHFSYQRGFVGKEPLSCARPFRDPHHSISTAGLLGGGTGRVQVGEVTLANHGILFLDEFPEFRRDAIEGLREPLEQGQIRIHRVGSSAQLPANFLLIAAMNPCPCGYSWHSPNRCQCRTDTVFSYRKKISGPILDRIDICVMMSMQSVPNDSANEPSFSSAIGQAVDRQRARFQGTSLGNGNVRLSEYSKDFSLSTQPSVWLENWKKEKGLSFRKQEKLLRLARTIADLEGSDEIKKHHLCEATTFLCLGEFLVRLSE